MTNPASIGITGEQSGFVFDSQTWSKMSRFLIP
jgi:hypothetical protein